MTHICVGKLTIIVSDNGLSPARRQAIIWNNAGILLIGPLGTNVNEILIGIQTFSFKKMHVKMASAKWRPFCLGLYVLIKNGYGWIWMDGSNISNSAMYIAKNLLWSQINIIILKILKCLKTSSQICITSPNKFLDRLGWYLHFWYPGSWHGQVFNS